MGRCSHEFVALFKNIEFTIFIMISPPSDPFSGQKIPPGHETPCFLRGTQLRGDNAQFDDYLVIQRE